MKNIAKILCFVLSLVLVISVMGVATFADETSTPTGTLSAAFTSGNCIWGDCGGNASESFVIKVYSDDQYLGSASLNNVNGIFDGDVYVTWSINLAGESDEYWTVEWYLNPSDYQQPTRVEQWVDGVMVAEAPIQLNNPDGVNKIVAATVDNDGYILCYYTKVADAIANSANGRILLLGNSTESIGSFSGVSLYTYLDSVTLTSTYSENYVDFDDSTVGYGVTLNVNSLYSGGSNNVIEGTLNVAGDYLLGYNAVTNVSGTLNVNGELTIKENDDIYSGGLNNYGTLNCGTLNIVNGFLSADWATMNIGTLVAESAYVYTYDCTIAINNVSINPNLDFKAVDNGDGTYTLVTKEYVAEANGVMYESLQEAILAGGEVTLLCDVVLTAQNAQNYFKPAYNRESYCGLLIPDDHVVSIDLAGYSIYYYDEYYDVDNVMILNLGYLTINDSMGWGAITYVPVAGSSSYSKFYSTIFNCGTVIVNGGTIENACETGVDVTNAIDNHSRLSHEYGNDCILVVNGGTIVGSYYYAIRQYTHYLEGVQNRVTINGGTIAGGVYMQHGDSWYYADPAKNRLNVDCYLIINDGEFIGTYNDNYNVIRSRLANPDNNAWGLEINGGNFNDAVVRLEVQRGVYYANGVSGTTVPAEATATRNAEWLADNGGFIKGGTFNNIGSSADPKSDVASFVSSDLKLVQKSDGAYGLAESVALPEIIDGYWWVGGINTGYIALPSITVENGYWVINGYPTNAPAIAENGASSTVSIGEDGFWYINDVKQPIKAQAVDGVGILKIEIVQELSDKYSTTYKIYFTDDSLNPVQFTIQNGLDGNQGNPGDMGETGDPGKKGDKGAPGLDGYDGSDVVIIAIIIGGICAVIGLIVLGCRVFKRDAFLLNL